MSKVIETKKGGQGKRTHGLSRTAFYRVFHNMKQRIEDETHPRYRLYGARGIAICDRWHKFENFRDDMYEDYLKHVEEFGQRYTSIERQDNDGDYVPGNVVWATPYRQARNRRQNTYFTLAGRKQLMIDWLAEFSTNKTTFYNRRNRDGLSELLALSLPVNYHRLQMNLKNYLIRQYCGQIIKRQQESFDHFVNACMAT